MLQAANTDLFNPLVNKAHNSGRQKLPFNLQIKAVKSVKAKLANFIFFHPRHWWVKRCYLEEKSARQTKKIPILQPRVVYLTSFT